MDVDNYDKNLKRTGKSGCSKLRKCLNWVKKDPQQSQSVKRYWLEKSCKSFSLVADDTWSDILDPMQCNTGIFKCEVGLSVKKCPKTTFGLLCIP